MNHAANGEDRRDQASLMLCREINNKGKWTRIIPVTLQRSAHALLRFGVARKASLDLLIALLRGV